MEFKNLVTGFVRSWNFTRGETMEILNSLTEKKLQFKTKGERFQTLAFQFACMGRTQLVYARAIKSGWMDFSLFSSEEMPKKENFTTKEELLKLLDKADKEWIEAIRKRREQADFSIKWPGVNKNILQHIMSLAEHERLHHGQRVTYFSMAGFEMHENFKRNWAL